ncbi:MAG: DUF3267 domain-containing protein [Firmicutes bacterium]|nr:DUF3267 domain-containing protein [Bacillota bacterium]
MRLHNAGKYNKDENSLPQREHPEGSVQFREPGSMKKFAVLMTILSLVIFAVVFAIYLWRLIAWIRTQDSWFSEWSPFQSFLPIVLFILSLIPHEIMHAIWFREDVYYYHNLSQGMLFVVGTEDMSKGRFIWMSLFPNIIFGFIPFILFLIWPNLSILGFFGAVSISAGAGDFTNVFNCLTQVPNGAITYMSGMHSYWYMPKEAR